MNFSVNQVTHLYVVSKASDLVVKKDLEGGLVFEMKYADGKPVRSDLITNITYAKAITAEKMQRKTRVMYLTTTDNEVVAGQDYVVRINYRKFVGISDEETYQELASARATATGTIDTTSGKNAGNLMLELAKNLALNTKKQEMVSISLIYNNAEKTVAEVKELVATSAANAANIKGILVKEIEQPWVRGIKQEAPVEFNLFAVPVIKDAQDLDWATIKNVTSVKEDGTTTPGYGTVIGNGKKIADYEYHALGDRADIYRKVDWPMNWPSDELLQVDSSKVYDVISIHYSYIGSNESVQKSEKDILLAMPAGEVGSEDHTVAAAVLAAINDKNVVTIIEPDEWNAEAANDAEE